ncbi:MAG: hypothetical protein HY340_03675 [Candidatus Kerfeldbacteria bacterium]|nr:hypothetical protein [Candidatus Kerfeldbacteria bacterium]
MDTPQQPTASSPATPALSGALPDLGTLFRSAFALYRTHLSRLLTLELILIIPTIILTVFAITAIAGSLAIPFFGFSGLLGEATSGGWNFFGWTTGLFLFIAVIAAFVTAWQQGSVLLFLRDPKTSYGEILKRALTMTPRVGIVAFLLSLAVILGFLVFFLPGIYLWVLFSQVVVVAVYEGLGTAAFRRSRELVAGHWWWVFGVTIAYTILIGVVSAILTSIAGAASDAAETVVSLLVSFFLAPLGVCFAYTLYHALRSARGKAV